MFIHCNNCCTNALQYYVIHALPVLYRFPQTQVYENVSFSRDTERRIGQECSAIETISYLLKYAPRE